VRALHRLNLAVLLTLLGIALAFGPRVEGAGAILLRLGCMGIGLLGIVLLERRGGFPALTAFYPLGFIPLVYDSLGPLILAAHPRRYDDALIALDRAIFGVDVSVWLERFVHPLLNDLMFGFYATYYFLPLVLAIGLWRSRREEAKEFFFTITFSYYLSYAGYFLVPAVGPRFALAHLQSVAVDGEGIARAISRAIDYLERSKLDVFPSGHTMIALVTLIFAFARARRLFWWLLPFGSGLILATLYCRYHYAIDLLAGVALAIAALPLGNALRRVLEGTGRKGEGET
jgi:membrane-associated phospholipid phosphatase